MSLWTIQLPNRSASAAALFVGEIKASLDTLHAVAQAIDTGREVSACFCVERLIPPRPGHRDRDFVQTYRMFAQHVPLTREIRTDCTEVLKHKVVGLRHTFENKRLGRP